MKRMLWNNSCPSGRSYRDHLAGLKDDGRGEDARNNRLTLQQVVIAAGGEPVRTHSGLAALFDTIGVGFGIDDSLEEDTAVIGRDRVVLRVTGLHAG